MDNNAYVEEMYNYLTQPENYSSALDLTENLNQVVQRLKDEFWQEVTNEIKAKVEEYQRSKSISLKFITPADMINCEWFQIRKDDWEFYFISTDKDDVGINVIESRRADAGCEEQIIKDEMKNFATTIGAYRNLGWICWRTFNKWGFQTKAEKMQILPVVRAKKISECSNEIFNYIEELIRGCDVINQKLTNKIR